MDKQIEEMAEVIEEAMAKARRTLGGHNNIANFYATMLVNAGYRKIPENSVVLTEGEYCDMISDEVETIEKDIAEYWATEDIESVAKELHKDGYRKLDDHAICVLRKAKGLEDTIRNETVDKFAEKLKAHYMPPLNEWDEIRIDSLFYEIDEIAKEIKEGL